VDVALGINSSCYTFFVLSTVSLRRYSMPLYDIPIPSRILIRISHYIWFGATLALRHFARLLAGWVEEVQRRYYTSQDTVQTFACHHQGHTKVIGNTAGRSSALCHGVEEGPTQAIVVCVGVAVRCHSRLVPAIYLLLPSAHASQYSGAQRKMRK
jgi:hypothetical protein